MGVILHKLLSRERFITIDEVETSIHYELLSYFLKVFLVNSDNGSQMLLTTHDVNLLDEDFIRRGVVCSPTRMRKARLKLNALRNTAFTRHFLRTMGTSRGNLASYLLLAVYFYSLWERRV